MFGFWKGGWFRIPIRLHDWSRMEPLDPTSLAIAAVGVAVVLSALLLLLFATREERYEDVVLAQRAGQDALQSRASSSKPTKQRKKPPRGKKKSSEHDEKGTSSHFVEEVDLDVEEEKVRPVRETADSKLFSEEEQLKPILKEHKEGKKKSKKRSSKDGDHAVTERHAHFSEGGKTREEEAEEEIVVEEIPDYEASIPTSETLPELFEEPVDSSEPSPPVAKKTKNKSKPHGQKDKPVISGEKSGVIDTHIGHFHKPD